MKLATYAVVLDAWPMGLVLEDAEDMDGTIVAAVEDADHVSLIHVGDLIARVNNVSVLGMTFADVVDLLGRSPSRPVLEFVPSQLRQHAQRVIDDERQRQTEESQSVPDQDELQQRLAGNPYAIVKTGRVLVQDRSVLGFSVARAWHSWHVVLRLAGLTYAAEPDALSIVGELGFVGRQCVVRVVPTADETDESREDKETHEAEDTEQYAVELFVDNETLVLACASEKEQTAWMAALTLAIGASNQPATLTADQITHLWQLLTREPKLLDDIQYRQANRRVNAIIWRLIDIEEDHQDPRIQESLREESKRLDHDWRVETAAIAHFDGEDNEWEELNKEKNHTALRAIRRCLPVDCAAISDAELASIPSPSGTFMSTELAHRLKQCSALELLRADPTDLMTCCSSVPTDKALDGLTLIKHRALHAHLGESGGRWRSNTDWIDSFGMWSPAKDKWNWFKALRETFRCVLDAYGRHISEYGPPDTILRAEAEAHALYAQDLGYPEDDVFTRIRLPLPPPPEMAGSITVESFDGFMTAPVAANYSSSNFWVDPKLLDLQLDANDLSLSHSLSMVPNIGGRVSPTEVYAGLYQDKPVAIKKLTLDGQKSLVNAAELATVARSLHQLKHRNLVSIMGLFWEKVLDIQVVTPLVARGDLRYLLDSSDSPLLTWDGFKCQVALDIVSALAYLHRRESLARMGAVTSWNILLDADGTAQLNLVQLPHRDLDSVRDRVRSPLRWFPPEII